MIQTQQQNNSLPLRKIKDQNYQHCQVFSIIKDLEKIFLYVHLDRIEYYKISPNWEPKNNVPP